MLTGRAVARIMHGLASPSYPAWAWAKNAMWARYPHVDFDALAKLATQEIVWAINKR